MLNFKSVCICMLMPLPFLYVILSVYGCEGVYEPKPCISVSKCETGATGVSKQQEEDLRV